MIRKAISSILPQRGPVEPPATEIDNILIYNAIWQNISREDANIGSRIGWAIGLSSGLFAAISFLTPRINDYCGGAFWPPMICAIIFGMSLLGVFFSYRTKLGVEAAHAQIDDLRTHYNFRRKIFEEEMGLPRPFGDFVAGLGRKSSGVYPIALLFFWSVIMVLSTTATVWTLASAAAGNSVGACDASPAMAAPAKQVPETRGGTQAPGAEASLAASPSPG